MDNKRIYLSLDVGEQRIGLAMGDSIGRVAQPLTTVIADGTEPSLIQKLAAEHDATDLVVGRPRDQSGGLTPQTERVAQFVASVLQGTGLPIHWQDESVTSVIAEERLQARKKPYTKADIDAEAASIILQDFLDSL